MESQMGGVVELTEPQWETLARRLWQDYQHQPSVMLIRSRTRQVLGFTMRRHRDWITNVERSSWRQPRDRIFLDFFDERLHTWFRLRYAEYLDDRDV